MNNLNNGKVFSDDEKLNIISSPLLKETGNYITAKENFRMFCSGQFWFVNGSKLLNQLSNSCAIKAVTQFDDFKFSLENLKSIYYTTEEINSKMKDFFNGWLQSGIGRNSSFTRILICDDERDFYNLILPYENIFNLSLKESESKVYILTKDTLKDKDVQKIKDMNIDFALAEVTNIDFYRDSLFKIRENQIEELRNSKILLIAKGMKLEIKANEDSIMDKNILITYEGLAISYNALYDKYSSIFEALYKRANQYNQHLSVGNKY